MKIPIKKTLVVKGLINKHSQTIRGVIDSVVKGFVEDYEIIYILLFQFSVLFTKIPPLRKGSGKERVKGNNHEYS